jgi:hypothetical protein
LARTPIRIGYQLRDGRPVLDEHGQPVPVEWRWWNEPNLLVSGGAGFGKTFLTQHVVAQAEPLSKDGGGGGLLILDPKRLGYRSMDESGRLLHPVWKCDFRLTGVYPLWQDFSRYLWDLYDIRMDYIEKLGRHDIDEFLGAGMAPVFVILEELQAVFSVMERDMVLDAKGGIRNVGKDRVKECQQDLVAMTALFRASGIRLVLISQSLNSDIIPTKCKLSCPAKLVFGATVADGDFMATFGDHSPKDFRFRGGVGIALGQFDGIVHELRVG